MGVADPNGLERPLKQQPGRGSESQNDRLTRGPAWGKRRREKDQGDDGFECAKSFDHCRDTLRALLRPKRKACWRPPGGWCFIRGFLFRGTPFYDALDSPIVSWPAIHFPHQYSNCAENTLWMMSSAPMEAPESTSALPADLVRPFCRR